MTFVFDAVIAVGVLWLYLAGLCFTYYACKLAVLLYREVAWKLRCWQTTRYYDREAEIQRQQLQDPQMFSGHRPMW